MSFALEAALSFLIGIPALLGWIRYKKAGPTYLPFVLLLTAGLLNEIISFVVISNGHSNVVNYNLYSLAETALLLWQFYRWEAFRSRAFYFGLQVGMAILWCADSFLPGTIHSFNSFQVVASDVLVVALAINVATREMFTSPGSLLRNANFLFCTGLVVFHTYSFLIELFWLQGLNREPAFRAHVLSILPFVNLFANFVYTLAVLWLPIHYRYFKQFYL